MIIDSLDNSGMYAKFGEVWTAAFDFLKQCRNDFPGVGRYEIMGDRAYALVQEYVTSPADERMWEAHRKYIDIQCVFEGSECIAYTPAKNMVDPTDYSAEKDCVLSGSVTEGSGLFLRPGIFGVFFPQDAHKPGCLIDWPEHVKKIVVKLLIDR